MPRRLAILNLLLLLVAGGSVAYIAREIMTPPRPLPLRPRPTVPETPAAPTTTAAPAQPPAAYAVVATRNLFSPSRTEGPALAAGGRPAVALPKPTLHGIILREGTPVAYLEDPTTKRVAGYRLGDSVAGGTVKAIAADHVVLARPDGNVDVRLRDPSKPRPAAPAASTATPVAGGTPGLPGLPKPGTPSAPGTVTAVPPTGDPSSTGIPAPPRRILPPSLLRRVPPSAGDVSR